MTTAASTFEPLPPDPGRVLVMMTDHHIGNFVVSAPVLRRLLAHFDCAVDVLVDESYLDLASLLLDAPRILGSRRRRGLGGIAEYARLVPRLAGRYAAVIDVGSGIRSSILVAGTMSRRRIGLDSYRRAWAYNELLPDERPAHVFDGYTQILRCIGVEERPPWRSVEPPDEARGVVDAALAEGGGPDDRPLAVIHPGAGKDYRLWPRDRFAAVADAIVQRHGARVCLIGAPGERPLMEHVHGRMKERGAATLLCLPLIPLLALLERAAVLVCNESGPMHMAALTPCPIVAIYGPTLESRWAPMRRERVAMLRGADCPPGCGHGSCFSESRCLRGTSVEDVLAAVDRVIDLGDMRRAGAHDEPLQVRAGHPLS